MRIVPTIHSKGGELLKPSVMFMAVQVALRELYYNRATEEEAKRRVQALVFQARLRASLRGPVHALWDVIFDAEQWLKGNKTIMPIEDIIEGLRKG